MDIRIDGCYQFNITYSADNALGVLIHGSIFRELKFVLQDAEIHVGVVVCPEWSLRAGTLEMLHTKKL